MCPFLQEALSTECSKPEHEAIFLFLSGTDENVLHLTFYYLMNLNIMTVKTKVTTAAELATAISAG